ncbi:MAG: hypothetical protein GY853_15835 [PVC group bacterium]|nr:hypothetical protein [PVC group bacterium]
MSRDSLSGRDLRAVSAINYQLYAEEALNGLKIIINKLGEKIGQSLETRRDIMYKVRDERRSLTRKDQKQLNTILNEVDHLQTIMSTAGDKAANNLLTDCLNELHEAINPPYPYDFPNAELIIMKTNKAIGSFKIAVSRHWQRKEGLSEQIQANAFKSQAIIGEPQVLHSSLKKQFIIEENIEED